MAMFVDPSQRVAVTDDKGNTVWIRAKMDANTRALVLDRLGATAQADGSATDETELSNIGSYRQALREANIVAWEGPDFVDAKGRPIPCTREMIRRMDPDDPLYDLVGDEIAKRNAKVESPDPNAAAASGSMTTGA